MAAAARAAARVAARAAARAVAANFPEKPGGQEDPKRRLKEGRPSRARGVATADGQDATGPYGPAALPPPILPPSRPHNHPRSQTTQTHPTHTTLVASLHS